ncbi:MAG: hypothetical protein Q4Q03_07145, partial [Bowdeniella nasicola]|nr:hypothetical protein [Bowdeniella nasicola]
PPSDDTPIAGDDADRQAHAQQAEDATALDPDLSAGELHAIAANEPDKRPAVALHPAAYPDLLTWLATLNDPQVDAALAQREGQSDSTDATEVFPAVGAQSAGAAISDRWTYGQEDYALAANQPQSVGSYQNAPVAQTAPEVAPTQQYVAHPAPAQFATTAAMAQGYGPDTAAPEPRSGGVGRSILIGVLVGLVLVAIVVGVLWWAPWADESEADTQGQAAQTGTSEVTASESTKENESDATTAPSPSTSTAAVDKSRYLPTNSPQVQSLKSPTSNIRCEAQSDTQWACTIFEHDFSTALGIDCAGPFSIRFDANGDPSPVCDVLVAGGNVTVEYGQTVQLGEVAGCRSEVDGMRCWDGASNSGFSIARKGITRYSS